MTQPQQEENEEEGTQCPLVLNTFDGLESAVEEDSTVSEEENLSNLITNPGGQLKKEDLSIIMGFHQRLTS